LRLFLYNYSEDGNCPVTVEQRVFGASDDGTGTGEKAVRDLNVGDAVLVRDTCINYRDCVIHGACVIDGPMVLQHRDKSLGDDLLWPDEKRKRRIVYPYRWAVEFDSAPIVNRRRVDWNEFDAVGAIGKVHGLPLKGRRAWEKKFRGNLITSPGQIEALTRIFDLRSPKESR